MLWTAYVPIVTEVESIRPRWRCTSAPLAWMAGAARNASCGPTRSGAISSTPGGSPSGLAIVLTTLVIDLMGNPLRGWLDPHLKL